MNRRCPCRMAMCEWQDATLFVVLDAHEGGSCIGLALRNSQNAKRLAWSWSMYEGKDGDARVGGGARPGALFARATRGLGRPSLDARS